MRLCRPLLGHRDRDAAIAQLVEHLIRNEGVGGSNPSCGTTYPFETGVKSYRRSEPGIRSPAAGDHLVTTAAGNRRTIFRWPDNSIMRPVHLDWPSTGVRAHPPARPSQ